jgi:hypothetical protein
VSVFKRIRADLLLPPWALGVFAASLWGPVMADHRGANLHTMQANAWLERTTRIDPQWILEVVPPDEWDKSKRRNSLVRTYTLMGVLGCQRACA